ncbi:hypothetical protein SGLAM104S_02236 [Streptomyces glaucescens]
MTVASLGSGDLRGLVWRRRTGGTSPRPSSPVRAYEFEAEPVLALCEEDPGLEHGTVRTVAEILAHRLEMTRGQLMSSAAAPPDSDPGGTGGDRRRQGRRITATTARRSATAARGGGERPGRSRADGGERGGHALRRPRLVQLKILTYL